MPCAVATVGQSGAPSGAAGAPQGSGLGEAKARVQAKLEKHYKLRFARDGKLCQRMKAKLLTKSGHPAWRETMGVSWQADAILAQEDSFPFMPRTRVPHKKQQQQRQS